MSDLECPTTHALSVYRQCLMLHDRLSMTWPLEPTAQAAVLDACKALSKAVRLLDPLGDNDEDPQR